MSAAYLSLIEGGQRPASEKALVHVAKRLGVDRDELATGKPTGTETRLELEIQKARSVAHRGESDEAQVLLEDVVTDASRYGLKITQAKALTLLGALAAELDEVETAADLYREAQNLLGDAPPHHRFETVVGLAQVAHAEGDTRFAIHQLETYLLELRKARMEDPAAVMRVNSALVQLYRALGLHRQATEAAAEAMRLSPQVEDPEQIACLSMNVARALYEDGKHDDAVEALTRAEQLYQMLDWPLPRIRARINKGIVLFGKGKLNAAKESFEDALAELEQFPNRELIRADLLNELGRAERLLGNLARASELLTEARKHLTRANLLERGFNAREMGLCLIDDAAGAQKELRRSISDYLAAGASREAARSLLELGRLLQNRDEHEEAALVLREGLELASES